MRTLVTFLLLAIATSTSCSAETLPESPRPHLLTIDRGLLTTDAAWRVFDTYTSYVGAHNPCRCITEADPISPDGTHLIPVLAFQAGMWLTIYTAHHYLVRSHHRKLARAALVIDNWSEGYAVINNYHHIAEANQIYSQQLEENLQWIKYPNSR